MSAHEDVPPILKAVSSDARQLFQLLNCLRFSSRAQVQISSKGIRFAVEDARVMQGVVFLESKLFTSFNYGGPMPNEGDEDDEDPDPPTFQVSLTALLETLQIFGFSDNASRFNPSGSGSDYVSNIRPNRNNAFSTQSLNLSTGICRISYPSLGSPFSIILEESGVITTCNLHTYTSDFPDQIPFDSSAITCKVIMQSRFLFDAMTELSTLNPTTPSSTSRLSITTSPRAPYLSLSTTGALGSSIIEFSKSKDLLETFSVSERWTQSYKFEMVKAATDAMRLASKVCIRGDEQGVLSLQFMIEIDVDLQIFVDFRFVPFISDEDDDGEDEEDDEEGSNTDDDS